jgi:hypothetical protein
MGCYADLDLAKYPKWGVMQIVCRINTLNEGVIQIEIWLNTLNGDVIQILLSIIALLQAVK